MWIVIMVAGDEPSRRLCGVSKPQSKVQPQQRLDNIGFIPNRSFELNLHGALPNSTGPMFLI